MSESSSNHSKSDFSQIKSNLVLSNNLPSRTEKLQHIEEIKNWTPMVENRRIDGINPNVMHRKLY